VLDIAQGKPGAGMALTLYRRVGDRFEQIGSAVTNAEGRCDAPLLEGEALKKGRYRLVFSAAAYFRACGLKLPEPPFVDDIVLDFGVSDAAAHFHVPLLVSPWSYSTYRGS
jgi:5-hydroxyisourate hydrolase